MKELNFDHDEKPRTLSRRSMDNRYANRKRFGKDETTNPSDPKQPKKELKRSRFNQTKPYLE